MRVLSDYLQKNEDGSFQMSIRFPDESAVRDLASSLSSLARESGEPEGQE